MDINNIEVKVDSAARLAAVANLPHNTVLFAPEVNAIVDEIKMLHLFSDLEIGLSWSKDPKHIVVDNSPNAMINVKILLIITLKPEIFSYADTVQLYIDRYRQKRKPRTAIRIVEGPNGTTATVGIPKFKTSGWRHPNPKINQPTEIVLTQPVTVLDFGQQHYFLNGFKVKGFGDKHRIDYKKAWLDLSFRIVVSKNNKKHISRRSQTLRMTYRVGKEDVNLLMPTIITYCLK